MTPRYNFIRRLEWTTRQEIPHKYTSTIPSGIFSKSVGIALSRRPSDHCSVFQAELEAIQTAVRIIGDGRVSKRNVIVRKLLRPLVPIWGTPTVYGYYRHLDQIAEQYEVQGTVVFCYTAELINLPVGHDHWTLRSIFESGYLNEDLQGHNW